jgi:hypothetical protein
MIFIVCLRTTLSPYGGMAPNFLLMLAAATRPSPYPSTFVYGMPIIFSTPPFPYGHRESTQDHSTTPGHAAHAPQAAKAWQVTAA